MLDRFLEALTGRRLGGALFVLCGLVVAAIVLWPGGDEDKPRIQPVRIVSVPQLGIVFAHPRTWTRSVAGRAIRLRTPDRSAVLTFSSPVKGSHTRQVKRDLKAALRKRFGSARVVREGPAKLGRRRVTSFEIKGTSAGDTVRILVLVGSTRYRTYAVALLTPGRPSAKRLAEAQQILATVRLTKPVRPKLPSKR